MKNYTYELAGRVNSTIIDSINEHAESIEAVAQATTDLQSTAIDNYQLLQEQGFMPSDLLSPDKQANGTCTEAEWVSLMCARAEKMWGSNSLKFKSVWRYMHDRDGMTGAEKKAAKLNHAHSARRSLKEISKGYANWLAGGCKSAEEVQSAPRQVTPTDEFIAKRLKSIKSRADKSVDELKAKYDDFDIAVFNQLLEPVAMYIDRLGKAKPSSKQVSFDSKGNRRKKK